MWKKKRSPSSFGGDGGTGAAARSLLSKRKKKIVRFVVRRQRRARRDYDVTRTRAPRARENPTAQQVEKITRAKRQQWQWRENARGGIRARVSASLKIAIAIVAVPRVNDE